MNAGVAIKVDTEEDRDGWIQLLEAFGIQEIYELPGLGVPLPGSIMVETASQISNFRPGANLVVVQPIDADFVQGKTSLTAFEHPDGAVYIFGGTITRLTQSDVRNALADHIYITAGELFPSQAGAIVLWDRYTKAVS